MTGDDATPEQLDGGWQTDVRRVGGLVLRSPSSQSSTIVRFLEHLHAHGFDAAPRPVDGGFAPDGREQFEFIEGESPQPLAWSEEAIWRIGELLRQVHDIGATFDPGPDASWRPWFARSLPGSRPVLGHGDLGPWNILAREGDPVAFIDWDNAGPVDALWEVAQAGWLNAQLHDDDVAALNDLPETTRRIQQLVALLDGYGLERSARPALADMMIEFAIRSAREEAAGANVEPDTSSPTESGFPLLWAVTWRTRAAAWMLDHRTQLRAALGD
jgi:aminoglycoside phosphotransferase (APT) family kinase protein